MLISMGQKAKEAAYELGIASTAQKDQALTFMAEELINAKEEIIKANEIDRQNAIKKGITDALLDRLSLDEGRIEAMAQGLLDIVKLKDPVGEVINMWQIPNGLQIGQKRVPMGVLGIIYESRPNVTSDAAGLCLKAGNAVILRGASDAINSNKAVASALVKGIKRSGLPETCVQLLEDTSRETATQMMRLNNYIDVLIPRGGAGLIKSVVQNATVPVIETGTGNCHIYVDETADFDMAKAIVLNAKVQRPGVCNAAEKLLVHEAIADEFVPMIIKELRDKGVEVRGCEKTQAIVNDVKVIDEPEWGVEYLDLIIAVKVVKDVDEAIKHINKYNTGHSESIGTAIDRNGHIITRVVDSNLGGTNNKIKPKNMVSFFNGNLGKDVILCAYRTFLYQEMTMKFGVKLKQSPRPYRPIYTVNHVYKYHWELKRWLQNFNGVATKYLNNYLSWFKFLFLGKVYKKSARIKDLFMSLATEELYITKNMIKNRCVELL